MEVHSFVSTHGSAQAPAPCHTGASRDCRVFVAGSGYVALSLAALQLHTMRIGLHRPGGKFTREDAVA